MPIESSVLSLTALFAEMELISLPPDMPQGAIKRRVVANSSCDLFVGIRKPENTRNLTARFRASALPATYEFPEFRSLNIQVQNEVEAGVERTTVTLRVVQAAANDLFTSLAEDVCRITASQLQEAQAAIAFQRRLLQWQQLLQKTNASGLTVEQQQGLYGELYCLREIVLPHIRATEAVSAWTGSEATAKDFQFAQGIALEVKTTQAKEPQNVTINSEKQLDDNGLNALFLMNISVEKTQGAGETLPEMVASLGVILSADTIAAFLFEDKLLASGYADADAPRYATTRYVLRKLQCFEVQEGFPRIIERDLPAGIGSVHYSLSIAACLPHTVKISDFIEQIGRQS